MSAYTCPHCSRPIVGTEAFCPHCGRPLAPVPVPARRSSRAPLVLGALVLIALLAAVFYGGGNLLNLGSPAAPPAGPAADVPPVGQVWFGRSFDTTTLAVRDRLTSVGVSEGFVMVGRLPRTMDASGLVIRAFLDGQLVGSNEPAFTGSSDTFGFNLGPLFAPGSYRYEIADVGGNVLASGSITAI